MLCIAYPNGAVAFQQEGGFAVGELQDEGILVLVRAGNVEWVEAVEFEAAEGEDNTALDLEIVCFGGKDRIQKMFVNRSGVKFTIGGNPGDREGLQYGETRGKVILA